MKALPDALTLENLLAEVGEAILAGRLDAAALRRAEAAGAHDAGPYWGSGAGGGVLAAAHMQGLVSAGACRLGVCCPDPLRVGDLASYLDHTLLKPEATVAEIDTLCAEAIEHRFASVCVNGQWAARCAEILSGSGVLCCAVVGFPLGAMPSEAKAYETSRVVEDGACEVDMVIPIGSLKSGDDAYVQRDIAGVVAAAHRGGARVKVIFETALLEPSEIRRACELAVRAGADFVKTSTGFSKGGATIEDVRLMRSVVGPSVGVKAAGGVRDRDSAEAMIEAGATRIGASAGIAIVRGETSGSSY